MKQYLDLLDKILTQGAHRNDRTGVGTVAIFGEQMRFDLSQSFPAVTTKKLAWKAVVSELLWFIEGSGDENRLKEILHGNYDSTKPTIWTGNATAPYWTPKAHWAGDLGVVYGNMWRKWPTQGTDIQWVERRLAEEHIDIRAQLNDILPLSKELKATRHKTPFDKKLYRLWCHIMRSCYDPTYRDYPEVGAQGVSVSLSWQNFDNFYKEIKSVAGFYRWAGEKNFVLYHNYYGAKQYSKNNAMFLDKKSVKEIETTETKSTADHPQVLRRIFYIDQLAQLIEGLKTQPYSRRHILNAWNPSELNHMGLPPCHMFSQFFVSNGKLSCQMYQRSQDAFLGNPFNIASYPLFIHMLAQVCGLEVGEYIHVMGDCHIYDNHIEAAKEQLKREPMAPPTLWLNPDIKDITEFTMADIKLIDYKSHDAIKAPMAV